MAIVSIMAGSLTALITSEFVDAPKASKIQTFQREGKPAVMRFYCTGADGLFVQDKEGTYIPLSTYLNRIPDKSSREIERAEIKKAVRWYEE